MVASGTVCLADEATVSDAADGDALNAIVVLLGREVGVVFFLWSDGIEEL